MIQHTKVARNFKEGAYIGQYRPTQMRSANLYVLAPIVKQVITDLAAAQMPFTKSLNFSLVNVFSPDNNMSMGFAMPPDSSVYMADNGLVLTFSMTPRVRKNLPDPLIINGRSRYWRMWGQERANEYVTITIPRTMLFGLNFNGIEYLNVLYNVIGAITRNYVNLVSVPQFGPAVILADASSLKSQNWGLSLQPLMRNVPFTEWHYCLSVWKDMSIAIMPDVIDKSFPLYYAIYLMDWIYQPDLAPGATEYVNTKVVDFIAKGMMKISAALASGLPDNSDEMHAALYALLKSGQDVSDMEQGQVGRVNFCNSYIYKLNQNLQASPDYQQKVVRMISSNQSAMARALVNGTYNGQLRDLVEYLALTKVG